MVKFSVSKEKTYIGLDIGKFAIKFVEFGFKKNEIFLKNLLLTGLSFETIVDDIIINTNEIIDRIATLKKLYKIKTARTAISLPGNSVIIKKLEVGGNTYDEIKRNVLREAPNHIPYNITEVEMTFFIADEESQSEKREVFLIAVKKEILDDYVTILLESQLRPEIADIDFFALQNIFEYNYSDEINNNELVAIVNIGINIINILVLKDFKSLFYRDSTISNFVQYNRIMNSLNIGFQELEKLKISNDKNIQIQNFIETCNKATLIEISKGIDLFLNSNGVEKVDKIFLSGGGSLQKELVIKIKERYNESEVLHLNPFKKIIIDDKNFDNKYIEYIRPQFAIAAGLALRGMDD